VVVAGTPPLLLIAIAVGQAACCPPPEPQYVGACKIAPAPVVAPAPAPPKHLPAPVLGRFQKPSQPGASKQPPKREMITEPPMGLPGPKLDEVPVERESLAPPKRAALPTATLPDEVVMRLLETGRAGFVRCFKKAIAADPTELSFKVKLRVELDENAAITGAHTDSTNPALDGCLSRSAAWLKFPAAGKRVVVELPLFYRGE
jgi:hypothetical protein